MVHKIKKMKKSELIVLIENEGEFLRDYPTDSFGGSNTGDAEVYLWKGNEWEINKERDGNKVEVGKIEKD